jgi:hypothetical protein
MQFVEIYGLRRSGHHAIISWLIKNLEEQYGLDKVYYINDASNSRFASGENLNKHLLYQIWKCQPEIIILSYEDVPTEISRLEERIERIKIVVVRDILNNAASRYQRAFIAGTYGNSNCHMKIDESLMDIWINHAKHPDIFKYEDFLLNKSKRDELSIKFGAANLDYTDKVNDYANGSSFVGIQLDKKENYLKRHEMVELPERILNLVNQPSVQNQRIELNYI